MKFFAALILVIFVQFEHSEAIVNGIRSESQPHNALIWCFRSQEPDFTGGGNLISDRHVLTSAFNLNGFTFWAIQFGGTARLALTLTVNSQRAEMHPNFDPSSFANDIGIIFLESPVAFNNLLRPIPLPSLQQEDALPLENEEGLIVGFGGTGFGNEAAHLEAAFQRTLGQTECSQFTDFTSGFCGRDMGGNSNLCWGDHGAGFKVLINGREILVGIVSRPGCGDFDMTTYARITHYRRWINEQTQV